MLINCDIIYECEYIINLNTYKKVPNRKSFLIRFVFCCHTRFHIFYPSFFFVLNVLLFFFSAWFSAKNEDTKEKTFHFAILSNLLTNSFVVCWEILMYEQKLFSAQVYILRHINFFNGCHKLPDACFCFFGKPLEKVYNGNGKIKKNFDKVISGNLRSALNVLWKT